MRTIELKLYSFDELTEQAKQKAIKQIRNSYYEDNNFAEWAIDDCALLEPPQEEMYKLFKDNYNFPLIKNNRQVYFSLDRDKHIDISKAMEIQNSTQFLTWLGLDKDLIDKVDYTIEADTIEFADQSLEDFSDKENLVLTKAVFKFDNHCKEILKRIEQDIDYRYTNEAIIEDIEGNDYEFLETGEIYN